MITELGINFDHILQKSLTVLNPLSTVDANIMDDADLAGPLVFCSVFAMLLLLVRSLLCLSRITFRQLSLNIGVECMLTG